MMNHGLPETHPSIEYYDSDYPSKELSPYPENFDETTGLQGIRDDVQRYVSLARETRGPILELCCGTGRVAIPLARAGFDVVAVDISPAMLVQFKNKLKLEPAAVQNRLSIVEQDIAALSLGEHDFALAIYPFNSLMCLPNANLQALALKQTAAHLASGALLMLDLVNPFSLDLRPTTPPRPFFSRKNVHTGNSYTRFAAFGEIGVDQVQELYGWYDEITVDGMVKRRPYTMQWRVVFPNEITMMLENSGFVVEKMEGDHFGNPYSSASRKMNVIARAVQAQRGSQKRMQSKP